MRKLLGLIKTAAINRAAQVIAPVVFISSVSGSFNCPLCGNKGLHPWEIGKLINL